MNYFCLASNVTCVHFFDSYCMFIVVCCVLSHVQMVMDFVMFIFASFLSLSLPQVATISYAGHKAGREES